MRDNKQPGGVAQGAQAQQMKRGSNGDILSQGGMGQSSREEMMQSMARDADSQRAFEILGSAASTFGIPADQLTIFDNMLLGKGTSARVFKASYQGSPVAAKIMNDAGDLDEAFQREVEILVQLMHPNILR
jgi:hypothetical protein